MKFFQIILATVFTVCFSFNISAQTVRPASDADDNIRVYNSKSNLLKKVRKNIERIQGQDPEGENDSPDNDQDNGESGKIAPAIKNASSDKKAKIISPEKEN